MSLPALLLSAVLSQAPPPSALDAQRLGRLLGLELDFSPRVLRGPEEWPVQILGTLVATHPEWSLAAAMHVERRKVLTLAVGDVVEGGEVVAIGRTTVTIRTAAGPRVVPVNPRVGPPGTGAAAAAAPWPRAVVSAEHEISRADLERQLARMDELATHARAVPAYEGGKPVGFRLLAVTPGSFYERMGVRPGDVLRRVNGYALTSPEAALGAWVELREASLIELEVDRRGAAILLRYRIR